ncbi:complement C1q-like protein 2 [Mytilus galloprovincialis]|uniref:complement C1q-like protein 2 n=1 Tax=Mytilus galloprovincialis TaxID=29158 RepID=UPI003F7CCEAA
MSLLKIIAWIGLLAMVIAHKQCSNNANLWKSIQYQLRLVESSDGRCDCGSKDINNNKMVGFLAKSSKTQQNVKGVVVFDSVVTNTGSGYDPSNGHFVAPYEGLYYFSWTILAYKGTNFVTEIVHNGKVIVGNHAEAAAIPEQMSTTNSLVLQLVSKDKVYIKTEGTGTSMHGGKWSSFTGFKI